jgi:DNA-binding IclR family transcriptional regulator
MAEKKVQRPAKTLAASDEGGRLDTTVSKAFLLFERLAASETPLGVSTLASELALQKSNVHRLLHTLSALGYVRQEVETKRYFPTLRAWEIGTTIVRRDSLRVSARRILSELHQATGESVFISVLSGAHILYLDNIDAAHSQSLAPQSGGRAPAIYPASGRAILAHQPDPKAAVEKVIAAIGPTADIDRAALMRDFKEIREKGYAVTSNGWRKGSSSLAAPIIGAGHEINAAVGLAGSDEHLPLKKIVKYARSVMNAAARIGELRVHAGVTSWEQ